MKNEIFESHLEKYFLDDRKEHEKRRIIIEDFEEYLRQRNVASIEEASEADITDYTIFISKGGSDTAKDIFEKYYVLWEYADVTVNERLLHIVVFLADGSDVMERISDETRKLSGDGVWNETFGKVAAPDISSTPDEKSDYAREIENRFIETGYVETYRRACEKTAHCYDPSWFPGGRESYLKCGSVDKFIESLNEEHIKELTGHFENKTVYFAQYITKEVLEHAKANPLYERRGEWIYAKKIPFSADRYLRETDEKMKRFHFCHCPWVKRSILQDKPPLTGDFCMCSLGYTKKPFEIAFGQELYGELLGCVLHEGQTECSFWIKIPKEFM